MMGYSLMNGRMRAHPSAKRRRAQAFGDWLCQQAPEAVEKRVRDVGRRAVFPGARADADRQTGGCGLSEAISF